MGQFMATFNPEIRSEPGFVARAFWYAAFTHPRHEKRVAQQLHEREIKCFVPLYRSVRHWKDRRKELELVLFPSYVFVHFELKDRLRVLQLPGVVRFVTFNGTPAVLPDFEIDALRGGLAAGVYAESHPYLKVGRNVRVVRGPLIGIQGLLVRKKDNSRIVVSVDAIRRSVALEIDESDVEPIY
jgi:transcription antitermination factor NusG